jgi:hypothetical protein
MAVNYTFNIKEGGIAQNTKPPRSTNNNNNDFVQFIPKVGIDASCLGQLAQTKWIALKGYTLSIIQAIVKQVKEHSDFFKIYQGKSFEDWTRFQMIVNSAIQEDYLASIFTFLSRQSSALWCIGDDADVGTDFIFTLAGINYGLEAKMYLDYSTFRVAITKATTERLQKDYDHIFHKADYVACYIITDSKPWHWLHWNGAAYEETTDLPECLKVNLSKLQLVNCYKAKREEDLWFIGPSTNM